MPSLKGQLLIAAPALADPNFARSVVLMVQHGEEGALGLVLNRPLETTVAEAWQQVNHESCDIPETVHLHQGGPCEGPLMVVHASQEHGQISVLKNLFFTTDKDMIEGLVNQRPGAMKFFVGYAGWGKGQLEREMEQGGWLTMPAGDEPVFAEVEDLWDRLMALIMKASAWGQVRPDLVPDDPSVN